MKKEIKLKRGGCFVPEEDLYRISKENSQLDFVYNNSKSKNTFSVKKVFYTNNDERNIDFNDLVSYFQPAHHNSDVIFLDPPPNYKSETCLSDYLSGQRPPVPSIDTEHSDTILNQNPGKKLDDGKLRWDLLAWDAVEKIVEVYTFGTKKYGDNTWQNVENFEARYRAALVRHLVSHIKGEKVDEESKILHLAHMAWNALALIWFELQKDKSDE